MSETEPAIVKAEQARRIAVVGEIPFAGIEVARALLARGFQPRVLCPDERSVELCRALPDGSCGAKVEISEGKLDNEDALSSCVTDAHGLVFVSPINLGGRIYRSASHIADVQRVLAAAEKHALRRVAYHGSIAAHPESLAGTLRDAAEAEALFHGCRCEELIIRTAPLMGPGDGLLSEIVALGSAKGLFVVTDGDNSAPFQPLHVGDFAACVARLFDRTPTLEPGPNTVHLAGPTTCTTLALLDQVLTKTNRSAIKLHLPLTLASVLASIRRDRRRHERIRMLGIEQVLGENDVYSWLPTGRSLTTLEATLNGMLNGAKGSSDEPQA